MKTFLQRSFAFGIAFLLYLTASTGQNTTSPATANSAPEAAKATPPPATVLTWSGFVKTDYIYDTRQTVNAREGDLDFAPVAVKRDANGRDVNDNPVVNFLSVQSRIRLNITSGDFFGMKTAGAIETEFLGTTNSDVNGLRIRHAYVQLTGTSVQLLMGQYWNPFFSTDCFPGVYNFNTGMPFATVDRSPQFRISSVGKTRVYAVLSTQRDFKNQGAGSDPANTTTASNSFSGLSLSGIPELSIGFAHADGAFSAGAVLDYKMVKLGLTNGAGLATDAKVSGLSAQAYLKYKTGSTIFKIQTTYGQNNGDMLMLGGFGVSDSIGKDPRLTPLASSSTWAEIEGGGATSEWGIFAGYASNLGFQDNLKTATGVQGFITDVKNIFRIAPRIGWKSNKTKIGVELEYTKAVRGSYKAGESGITELATDSETSNLRILATAVYTF